VRLLLVEDDARMRAIVERGLTEQGHNVVTASTLDAPEDVVASLDAGADDHLTKPFSFVVLLARIRALGRRRVGMQDERVHVADLVIDTGAHTVTRGSTLIALTRTEFSLQTIRGVGYSIRAEREP
jgi:DNA-binding response OmpR family regulator